MDTAKSPTGSVRRHARNISHPMPRRSTKGPLDTLDDPLADNTSDGPQLLSPTEILSQATKAPSPRPESVASRSTIASRPRTATIDIRFLQNRDNYHQLPHEDIVKAFAESEHQPSPGTALADLLQNGHFRRAAEAALSDLLQAPSAEADVILQLLYTRLACLILIKRPDLAASEALPLTELLARKPPGAKDIVPLVPWVLRLLLIRLQSIGATDRGRRGIMALYALAGEVRVHVREAREVGHEAAVELWSSRLRDLGLRVADALVEMGELETATRHLDTLVEADATELAYRKALLKMRVGDVVAARQYVASLTESRKKEELKAVLQLADGDAASGAASWRALSEQHPDNELLTHNLAVCSLYSGNIIDAREILEDLATSRQPFPTLLFNVSTIYELCTERSVEAKVHLSERLAARQPASESGGWERAAVDFKL